MSEGAAESVGDSGGGGDSGSPLSGDQFGDVTGTTDLPGQTAQSPGTGIFGMGYYPWSMARPRPRHRRKKRKRG